ncbi:hypothetical protein P3X46_019191 [Hevea brasiliensis]|uniref:EF-hand domain-containing protein n=1 Tax=Hevea brasiliensis TaxID=3981 RepID=A0ABQ9LHX0_HEVBR|nr:calmodulin-like protein 7 [Hevea brasiliensis]KAJ9167569.1 hypothetical protein P3X46_019191 [Hevea brasiliensis]
MMNVSGLCSRLVGELVEAMGVAGSSSPCLDPSPSYNPQNAPQVDDFMIRALTVVFGMENNGKIKKENARQVVEKLGLIYGEEEEEEEENKSAEVPVEEVLNGLEKGPERQHLLHEAFKIFDEDGNGYIEAVELKRVLQCLGLDKGWDMSDIEKMLKVVDLNLDGRIDFSEFELMMSQFNFLFSLNCIFFPNNRWVLITCSPSLTSFNQLTFNLPKLQSQ